MRIGILGGTFDPPHVAHLILAEEARLQLGLQTVLWVPAGVPWRKADRQVSPVSDRVEMVRRAISGNDGFELCAVEAEEKGPSHMVKTLEVVGGQYQESELFLVLGSDALVDLPNWRDPARLIALARLALASRGEDGEGLLGSVERELPGVSNRIVWVAMPKIEISSTELRRRVDDGRGVRYFVPDNVRQYIREAGLYRSGA